MLAIPFLKYENLKLSQDPPPPHQTKYTKKNFFLLAVEEFVLCFNACVLGPKSFYVESMLHTW
jgi:hypothetical protein